MHLPTFVLTTHNEFENELPNDTIMDLRRSDDSASHFAKTRFCRQNGTP